MMKKLLVAAALAWAGSAQAQVVEVGDAGQTLAGAQNTVTATNSAITTITGSIANANDVDLYRIFVNDFGNFSASTINGITGEFFDTKLYLFDSAGQAIASADDTANALTSILPRGNALYASLTAGTYFLGISNGSLEASNGPPPNQDLFVQETASNQLTVRGAATGVNPAVLGGFITSNLGFDDTGTYRIDLTGVTTGPAPAVAAAVPEPATWGMMILGVGLTGAALRTRRRRVSAAA